MITLFSTCKPFEGLYDTIQRNAIQSWLALSPRPQIILLGFETGVAEVCQEYGIQHIPAVHYTRHGKPDMASLFTEAQAAAEFDIMAYVNADICLFDDFLAAIDVLRWRLDRFIMCGQRHNYDVPDPVTDWDALKTAARAKGDLLVATGTDYFVFRRGMLRNMAHGMGIGNLAWDNFLPWSAVKYDKAAFIDATAAVFALHQNHPITDYSGHPGAGQNHWIIRQLNPDEPGAYCGLFLKDNSHLLTAAGLIPKVSIVLPSYNRPDRLERALWGIQDVTHYDPLEIIVVIDVCHDSHQRVEALNDPRVRVLFNEDRAGIIASFNQGLAASTGHIVAFWNDDCMPEAGWLEAALRAHEEQLAGYGLVGFNDGYQDGAILAVQYLFDRPFCRDHLGGVMAYPVYEFAWNDTEANGRAKNAGRFYWCREAVVQHLHWSRDGGTMDALNRDNMAKQGRDGYIYYAREKEGFPNTFEAVI